MNAGLGAHQFVEEDSEEVLKLRTFTAVESSLLIEHFQRRNNVVLLIPLREHEGEAANQCSVHVFLVRSVTELPQVFVVILKEIIHEY